jgi:hypothetical protein
MYLFLHTHGVVVLGSDAAQFLDNAYKIEIAISPSAKIQIFTYLKIIFLGLSQTNWSANRSSHTYWLLLAN